MASLIVLKVRTEAVTASFRYPRIQIGRLPTFDMPPPATIYGHLAGVVGEWFDPTGLEFAYVFEHIGKGMDVETSHPIELGSGKLGLQKRRWDYPINVECSPNPQKREFLLRPKMTLYLRGEKRLTETLQCAFSSPAFPYVLGRSQDLATVLSANVVDLDESAEAFFSHTLLPYEWRAWVLPGASVALPCAINYSQDREARQQRYLQLTWPPLQIYPGTTDILDRDQLPRTFSVDLSDQRILVNRSLPRGLYFHPVSNQ